jgi:ribonuclease E
MTFYEAALRVLEAAGHPLHFQEITERSIQQNLLSHVGKTPELTMLSRLLAMARRKTDRKVVVTSKDKFALADWALPEEPDALALTAQSEQREEDNLPPLRPTERHPEPRAENVRIAGRGVERKRRRDEEEDGKRRKKKFPPVPEVVFEILSDEGGALRPRALAERARERGLASDELRDEQILTALLEDNQRRIDAGRRPQFLFDKEQGAVFLERAGAPSEAPPLELQAAFAAALGIPIEGGRPVLPARSAGTSPEVARELGEVQDALKVAVRDARRATARALRRKLSELDQGTFEKSVVKVLHAEGFRELKVAKRFRDGQILTARKKEGSLELRFAIRVLHGAGGVDRKAVQEARRDAGHQSANVSLLVSPGDVRSDARGEAVGAGSLVFLWCGEALAERFLSAGLGVNVTRLESYEIDDRFFEAARLDAEESARRREERQKEKKRDEPRRDEPRRGRDRDRDRPPREPLAEEAAAVGEGALPEGDEAEAGTPRAERPERPERTERPEREPPRALAPEGNGDDDEEGDEDEGEDELEAAEAFAGGRPDGEAPDGAEGQPGERKRRRRRRRGRRGRGARPEGGAEAPGGPAAPGSNANGNGNGGEQPVQAAPPPPPPPPNAGEGGAPS